MNHEATREEVLELLLLDARQEIERLQVSNAQMRIIITKMQEEAAGERDTEAPAQEQEGTA